LGIVTMDDDIRYFDKPFRNLSGEEKQLAKSIIMERHFALNWICGYSKGNSWDDTPTST
jgi:hypothetical protein